MPILEFTHLYIHPLLIICMFGLNHFQKLEKKQVIHSE